MKVDSCVIRNLLLAPKDFLYFQFLAIMSPKSMTKHRDEVQAIMIEEKIGQDVGLVCLSVTPRSVRSSIYDLVIGVFPPSF